MSQSHVDHPESTPTLKKTKLASPSLYEEINVFIKSALDSLKHMPEDIFLLKDILLNIGEHISQHQKSINEFNSKTLTESILFITNKYLSIYQKLREENKKSDALSTSPTDEILDKSYRKYINDDFIENMTSKIQSQLLANNDTDNDKSKIFFLTVSLNNRIKCKNQKSYNNHYKFLRIEIMKYINHNSSNKNICEHLEIFEKTIVKITIYLKEALFHSIYDKIAESTLYITERKIIYNSSPEDRLITLIPNDIILYLKNILKPTLKNIHLIQDKLLNHHDEPQDIEMEREEIKRIEMQLEITEKTLQESSQLLLPSHNADINEITSLTYKTLNASLEVYRSYIDQLGVIYSMNNVIPTELMETNMDTTPQCWAEIETDNVLASSEMIK